MYIIISIPLLLSIFSYVNCVILVIIYVISNTKLSILVINITEIQLQFLGKTPLLIIEK